MPLRRVAGHTRRQCVATPGRPYAAASPAGEHGKRSSDRMSYVNL